MKKITNYLLLLSGLLVSFTACKDKTPEEVLPDGNQGVVIVDDNDTTKYADININYKLEDAALAALNENDIPSMFSNMTYEGLYRDYQRTTNLTHDMYAGYVANNKPSFNTCSPAYQYTEGWSGLRWEFFYNERTAQEYAPLLKIFYFKDRAKYKNAFYILRIYWAFLASMQTDSYGECPLSAYVRGLIPSEPEKVKYDTQEECYDIIFRILEQAVDSIVPNACSFKLTGTIASGAPIDRCYGGDETKWLRFANTLRLRLALRISNVDPVRAKKEGEAALANKWGLMQSDADRMRTVPKNAPVSEGGEGEGGSENVIAMCCMMYNGDMVLGKDLELAYKNQSVGGADNYYLASTTVTDDGTSFDVDFSYWDEHPEITDETTVDPATWQHSMIDPRCKVCWFRPTTNDQLQDNGEEFVYMDYCGCEQADWRVNHSVTVEFFSMAATDKHDKTLNPKKYFSTSRESVWLGYAETQFLLAEAALRGWSGVGDTPEGYYKKGIRASMNYFEISTAETNSYINGLMIYQDGHENPFETNNRELALEQIITQKWLAVFPNGNEGWAEFRRTDYPRLRLPLHNEDGYPGYFIKRIRYPESALDNVNRPQKMQNDRVWWDVENTMDGNGNHVVSNNFR